MRCEEAPDLITALVDSELSSEERTAIEDHLQVCPRCRLVYREEQGLKNQLRMVGSYFYAPAHLRQAILSEARASSTGAEPPGFWEQLSARKLFRPVFATALLVLFIPPVLYLAFFMRPTISLMAVATYGGILRGETQLVSNSNPEKLKEQLAQAVQGRFSPMGYDFSMTDLKQKGGLVSNLAGRSVIAVVYESKAFSLICYTFLGTEGDAPPSARIVFDSEKKMNFYTFTKGGVNAVMHRENDEICILASNMPMPELLALARSKAHSI
jgi:anti-sigma factor RsiW